MTKTIVKHCIFVRALPPTVWSQVSNLRSWAAWNSTFKTVEFKGHAAVGARGRFYLASGPATPFEIIGLHAEKFIQLEAPLLWLGITMEFRIVEITEGSVLTYELSCSGRAAALCARMLKRLLAPGAQSSIARLKACLEKQSADQEMEKSAQPSVQSAAHKTRVNQPKNPSAARRA